MFVLRTPDDCAGTAAPTPVAVSVKRRGGGRWVTMAAADQCDGFQGRIRKRNFLLEGRGAVLLLFAETDRFRIFRYKISDATVADDGSVTLGATLRSGRFFTLNRRIWRVRSRARDPRAAVGTRFGAIGDLATSGTVR